MDWTRNARGGADMKMVLAVLFAVGGLSWAVISFVSGMKSDSDSAPRVIAAVFDDEGNEVDTNYTKASNQPQIDSVQAQIAEAISSKAKSELGKIEVPKGLPDGISEATINAFIPILSGDHDSFIDAIAAMGGKVPGDLDGDHSMFTQLAGVFKHAKVDLDRITVERFIAQERGNRGRVRRDVTKEEAEEIFGEDGSSNIKTRIHTNVMEIQPASMFPDAPPKADPTAIQIKIPVQPKGEKDESIFSLVLTWNKEAKKWQPAAYMMIRTRRLQEDG